MAILPSIPPFLWLFCLLSHFFCGYFCLLSHLFCGYFASYPTFSVHILPSIPPFLWLFCLLFNLFCGYFASYIPPILWLFCLLSHLFCGYFAYYTTFSVAIFASYASFSVFYFSSVSPIFHLLSLLYPTFCPSYILVFSHLVSNDIFASIVLPFSVIVLSSVVFVYTSIPL